MFEEEEIGGVYWKSGKDENNETYYKKEDPTRFLSRKVVGRWTISKYLNNHTYVMFQTLYNETSDWIVYLAYMTSFEQIPGIVSRPGYEDRWPAGQVKNNNTALIICLGTVVAVIICIPGILCWKKNKKQNTKEEPEMEKNANYGVDDEYYDEHDSRVQIEIDDDFRILYQVFK